MQMQRYILATINTLGRILEAGILMMIGQKPGYFDWFEGEKWEPLVMDTIKALFYWTARWSGFPDAAMTLIHVSALR